MKCEKSVRPFNMFKHKLESLNPSMAIPFLSLFSFVQPTQIFARSDKTSYAEGNEGNEGNDSFLL